MKTFLFSKINNTGVQNSYSPKTSERKNNISFGLKPLSLEVIPDLKQSLIPRKRNFCCGPVSVANGIIMLAQRGFPNLYTGDYIQLIKELARHFKTSKKGTTMNDYCSGLESFVKAKGYESEIHYEGFREVNSKYKRADRPDLEWVKKEIEHGKAVFMNVGSYRPLKSRKPVFQRTDGHYVFVVGSNNNGVGFAPNYLTIHDPYVKATGDCFVQTERIKKGKFIHNANDNEGTVTDKAKNFYKIWPFSYLDKDEIGIVNGIVTLGVK